MKMYARVKKECANYSRAPQEWTEVKYENRCWYPSGNLLTLHFVSGIAEKSNRCEIIYIFEK